MEKQDLISKMKDQKLIIVIRGESFDEGKKIIDACISGGIKVVEITYSMKDASELISYYHKNHTEIITGAGTVLDSETARIAIISGAQFIVSPTFDEKIAKTCNRYSIPYFPGCMTLTESIKAIEYGADIIKLFPSSVFEPSIIKAFKGPIPNIQIMPTGGVNVDNVLDWLKEGAVMVGVGGEITNIKNTYDEITDKSRLFLSKIKGWENGE